jgi:hypothetical protein
VSLPGYVPLPHDLGPGLPRGRPRHCRAGQAGPAGQAGGQWSMRRWSTRCSSGSWFHDAAAGDVHLRGDLDAARAARFPRTTSAHSTRAAPAIVGQAATGHRAPRGHRGPVRRSRLPGHACRCSSERTERSSPTAESILRAAVGTGAKATRPGPVAAMAYTGEPPASAAARLR